MHLNKRHNVLFTVSIIIISKAERSQLLHINMSENHYPKLSTIDIERLTFVHFSA